ncbi:MAG: spore coat U domain-containing protein [Thiohalomonadaceae bacterium]
MSHKLLHYCAALLLGLGLFAVETVHAKITCTNISISNVTFGNVDPQSSQTDVTATLSFTCKTNLAIPSLYDSATLCFSIGESYGAPIDPRHMYDTVNNTLAFQLYQNSTHSIIWGSQFHDTATPLMRNITLRGSYLPEGGTSMTGTATMYGRVRAGQQTAIPGSYTNTYTTSDTAITVNSTPGLTPPGMCSSTQSGYLGSFIVSANVVKKCTVTARPLDFGNAGLLLSSVFATTSIDLQCSRTTPYNVGLDAGQNGSGNINARKMVLGANSVVYQLYKDAARTVVWGDSVGIGTGTVAGTGTGFMQNIPVYGTVPAQLTPPAGTYTDTIVVTVTY